MKKDVATQAIRMPSRNLIACFRSPITSDTIDAEAGIIKGVKVMELGKLAEFAAPDGKASLKTKITNAHIDALLSHAGNRAIPVHLTHDWHGKSDTEEMRARIGALKQLRKDDDGNLVADLFLKDGSDRKDILWSAEHNPEDTMLSAVFEYRKDDPKFIPQNFQAADIVPRGAGVTALFSATNENTMDILDQLKEAASDPAKRAALKTLIRELEKGDAAPEETTQADAMMSAAGVTDADKSEADKDKPVLIRAHLACTRALSRQAKTAAAQLSETQKGEITTLAKAAVIGEIGKGKFLSNITGGNEGGEKSKAFVARLSKYLEAGESQGRAIALAKQRAEASEVSEWETAGRPMPSKAA